MLFSTGSAKVRRVDEGLDIVALFDGENFAFDIVEGRLDGAHPLVRNSVSDRIYYFLEGAATVQVNDSFFEVVVGDLVVVPKGALHGLCGKARYLVVTSPPFDPANEHLVECLE